MNANQFLHYELFIGQTHDAFVLEAKSFATAIDEAKEIIKEYAAGKLPRQITALVKSCKISSYTSHLENPAFLEESNKLHTVKL